MKNHLLIFYLLVFMLASTSLLGQRFSLLAELGGLRGQVEGDKITGFFYNGFTLGIGSNYTITPDNFFTVKTSYYSQGSRRRSSRVWEMTEGVQIEMDLNSVGLEFGYKYEPQNKFFFAGASYLRHQLVSLDYEVVVSQLQGAEEEFDPATIRSGFNSAKVYYGIDVFPRASVYGAFEISFTNMLESDFFDVDRITPYSVSLVFAYEIFAAKEVQVKARPGSKTRQRR